MFWLRNKKIIFSYALSSRGLMIHTRSSEGCSGNGMALDVDALCVVPSFVFWFLLMCYRALLCFACFALLFVPFTINFIHYPICVTALCFACFPLLFLPFTINFIHYPICVTGLCLLHFVVFAFHDKVYPLSHLCYRALLASLCCFCLSR